MWRKMHGEYVTVKQNEQEQGITRQRKQICLEGKIGGSKRRNKRKEAKAAGRKFHNKATLPRVRCCFRLKFLVTCTGSSLSSLMRSGITLFCQYASCCLQIKLRAISYFRRRTFVLILFYFFFEFCF